MKRKRAAKKRVNPKRLIHTINEIFNDTVLVSVIFDTGMKRLVKCILWFHGKANDLLWPDNGATTEVVI